jgi:hypothetical protein
MTDSRGGVSKQEQDDLARAEALLLERRWADAKVVLLRLAAANRAEPRYRALLALALGHEADDAGDGARARVEWARADKLDPSLRKRGTRSRRPSLVQRLFGRA